MLICKLIFTDEAICLGILRSQCECVCERERGERHLTHSPFLVNSVHLSLWASINSSANYLVYVHPLRLKGSGDVININSTTLPPP